jgi:hypothetical protein
MKALVGAERKKGKNGNRVVRRMGVSGMKNGMADMGFGGLADIPNVPAMCSLMHGLSMARSRRFVQRFWEGKEDEIEKCAV